MAPPAQGGLAEKDSTHSSAPYGSVATDGRPPASSASTASARSSSASTQMQWRARCSSPFPTRRAGEPGGRATRAVDQIVGHVERHHGRPVGEDEYQIEQSKRHDPAHRPGTGFHCPPSLRMGR